MSDLNHKNYKIEKINNNFIDWAKIIQMKRVLLKLDKKPLGLNKFTNELMKKQSIKELERELLGEPHIRDIWDIDKKKKNKTGSIFDIFLWVIVTVFVILFFGIFLYAYGIFHSAVLTIPSTAEANFTEAIDNSLVPAYNSFMVLRWIAFIIVFGMIINIFVSNYFIKTYPVFFVIYLLIVVVGVIASAILSNAYQTMFNTMNTGLQDSLSSFTAIHYVIYNLPVWTAIVGVIGLILLFLNIIIDRPSGMGGEII